MTFNIRAFGLLFVFFAPLVNADAGWRDLFDGKSLAGWKRLGGDADYLVENGEIVGITKADTENSFLVTESAYGDFILEFDVKAEEGLNSGVQFRSNSRANYQNGRVHGYQAEIDTSTRAYSGGIYDEARRGWIYPLSRNDAGRKAFHNGEWNHYRIEAIGARISIWVNGKQTARLIDDLEPKGFIALQVHQVEKPEQVNRNVRWRNVRIQTENLQKYATLDDPSVDELSYLHNRLSETEQRQGWRMLWGGSTSKGWKPSPQGWEIKDSILSVKPSAEGKPSGDHWITTQTFYNFELQLEFKLSKGAESGILYFVNAEPKLDKQLEFQLIDDKNNPVSTQGIGRSRAVGALYDLIPPENLSIPGRDRQYKGAGEWNQLRIVARNGKVEHWLNNEKTVEYDRSSQTFRALLANSPLRDAVGLGQISAGHIVLQNLGAEVQFKNIKIRE